MTRTHAASSLSASLLTAALLAAVASPLPVRAGERGAGTLPRYFGLEHIPFGNAEFSTDSAGRLVVRGLGSSGQDGVCVMLGKTNGFAMQCDFGQSGALAAGTDLFCSAKFDSIAGSPSSSATLRLTESNSGQCDVGLSYTGPAATCMHVRLLLSDAVVADSTIVHPPGSPPGLLASGNIGSHDDGSGSTASPPTLEMRCDPGVVELSIFRPSTGTWLVSLPGGSPVACDQVSVTLEGLPPVQRSIENADVLVEFAAGGGGGGAGGSIYIEGESLRVRPKGWDGTIKGAARALGEAHIAGVMGADICAGCYECCHPDNGNALSVGSGVLMSNIGSSGQDGVSVFCRNWGSPWFFPEIELMCSPLDLSLPDASVAFRVRKGMQDLSVRTSTCRIDNNQLTGTLDLSADFSALNSVEALIEVRSGGAAAGSVLVPNMPGAVLASLLPGGSGLPLHVTRCANLAGDSVLGQSGFELHFDSDFMLLSGGQLLLGDELRVRAADSTLSTVVVEEMVCDGKHIRQAILTCRGRAGRIGPPPPSTVVHSGLVHTALGQSGVQSLDVDGDGRAELMISNIGSSGQDGVSVDLGHSQGAGFDYRVSAVHDGLRLGVDVVHARLEIVDDECVDCPAGSQGVLASVDIDATSTSSATYSAHGREWGRGHVTLMKFDDFGELQRLSLPHVDDEEWSLSAAAGSQLTLRYHEWTWNDLTDSGTPGGASNAELEMHTGVGQRSSAGVVTGVTVSHPLHGVITNVHEIIVSQCGPAGSAAGTVERAQMLFSRGNPTDICMRSTDLAQFGNQHAALGQSQLISEDCDDVGNMFTPTLWVANIGSSGQDGVEVRLPRRQADNDCDGDALPDVVGATAIFRPSTGTWYASTHSMIGSLAGDAGNPVSLASMTLDSSNPGGSSAISCDHMWSPDLIVTATVRDQLGNVVLTTPGLPSGPMGSMTAIRGDDAGAYNGSFVIVVTGSFKDGGSNHAIAASTQTLHWTDDVSLTLPGQATVVGRSLELHAEPSSGTPVPADLSLYAMRVQRQSPPGSTGALGIIDEDLTRLPAPTPCPADIAPIATNGDHVVDVSDLLAVITSWGACSNCAACPADIAPKGGDCQVDVTDLLRVITSWGACP